MTDNQKPSTVNWNDLAAFMAVARLGGLTAAALDIGSSAPTLGRRMRALERSLGRDLFIRRTHGYDLTDAGAKLQEDLRLAESSIVHATIPARGNSLPVVRITAGSWTMLSLVEMLPKITGQPRDLAVRLLQDEDVLSIPRREAAIGFRNRRPTETGLAGRKLRSVSFAPYAVKGAPTDWIVVKAETPSAKWVAQRCGNNVAAETNVPRLALDLALKGCGWILLPTFVGDTQPQLERVGAIVEELTHDQWLVTHDDDRSLPEVRRALDRIRNAINDETGI